MLCEEGVIDESCRSMATHAFTHLRVRTESVIMLVKPTTLYRSSFFPHSLSCSVSRRTGFILIFFDKSFSLFLSFSLSFCLSLTEKNKRKTVHHEECVFRTILTHNVYYVFLRSYIPKHLQLSHV